MDGRRGIHLVFDPLELLLFVIREEHDVVQLVIDLIQLLFVFRVELAVSGVHAVVRALALVHQLECVVELHIVIVILL